MRDQSNSMKSSTESVRIPNNGAQKRFLDGPARMDRHHGSSIRLWVSQHQVTSFLPVFDKSGALN
jgi:hypothetical protein